MVAAQVSIPVGNNSNDVVVCSAYFPEDARQDQPSPLVAYYNGNNKQLVIECDANAHHRSIDACQAYKSTDHALNNLVGQIGHSINHGEIALWTLLDIEGAFNNGLP